MNGNALAPLSFLPEMSALGPSELFYLFIVGATVLSSLVLLRQPFVNLGIAIFFLVSANTAVLGAHLSAAIAALLIGNCLIGIVLVSGFKATVERDSLRVPFLLCAIAVLSAVYGFAHGNQVLLILGDFYQIIEFASLFVLARMLVKTEQQLRAMTNVLIGSIVATSVLQMVDALMEASYLANSHLERQTGPDLLRTINMNAPIAFVALLAAIPVARTKRWLVAGLGLVEINLILGFTRGLWAATLASAVFLLMVTRDSRAAILKFGFGAGVFAIAFLYVTGLGTVAADRLGFGIQQLRGVPKDKHLLSGRRRLEFTLILPQIAEHPFMGEGLGATYRISGDAILDGPQGEIVENHYIHNLYLQVAFRLGIPVLLILLALLWTYVRRSLGSLRASNLSPENSALMAGLIAAMFGEVLLSLTSPTLLNHPTAGVIGCIMAMTTSAWRFGDLRPDSQAPDAPQVATSG